MFATIREDAFQEEYMLKFCGETYSDVWLRKKKVAVALDQVNLNLVVKRLHCINCLNAWATNCGAFWNKKLCCDTVFLHKNDETKNSSDL